MISLIQCVLTTSFLALAEKKKKRNAAAAAAAATAMDDLKPHLTLPEAAPRRSEMNQQKSRRKKYSLGDEIASQAAEGMNDKNSKGL